MLMSIDRSCHFNVTFSGSATSIVHVSDDKSQKPEDLPGETYQHLSASFRRTARTINTLPPLSRTPRVLGMENSFTVKKERQGSQLVTTVSVLSKAHFLLQKDRKPQSCRVHENHSRMRSSLAKIAKIFAGAQAGAVRREL